MRKENSRAVTTLKFYIDCERNAYYFHWICMNRDHFAPLKGKQLIKKKNLIIKSEMYKWYIQIIYLQLYIYNKYPFCKKSVWNKCMIFYIWLILIHLFSHLSFFIYQKERKKKVQIIIFKFQPAGNIIFLRSTKVIYTSKHKSMNSEVETSTTTLWRL